MSNTKNFGDLRLAFAVVVELSRSSEGFVLDRPIINWLTFIEGKRDRHQPGLTEVPVVKSQYMKIHHQAGGLAVCFFSSMDEE